MSRGIPGHPGNCKKIMKYNWSFHDKPLSKTELNRLRREKKKERAKNRKGNVRGYKINKDSYTGYRKVCKTEDWEEHRCGSLKFYVNRHTNQLIYEDHKPSPIKYWYFESIAEHANIKPVLYTTMRNRDIEPGSKP